MRPMRLRQAHRRPVVLAGAGLLAAGLLAACSSAPPGDGRLAGQPERVSGGASGSYIVPPGIHKIKHVIIVMQENRSFDSYFGTYPGADGIPVKNGQPAVCIPNPRGPCVRPYHDTADINGGGPHSEVSALADVNGGAMDGFIVRRDLAKNSCKSPEDPACSLGGKTD